MASVQGPVEADRAFYAIGLDLMSAATPKLPKRIQHPETFVTFCQLTSLEVLLFFAEY